MGLYLSFLQILILGFPGIMDQESEFYLNSRRQKGQIYLLLSTNLCSGGYCLALDMTARDFQNEAKAKGHPWTMAKVGRYLWHVW